MTPDYAGQRVTVMGLGRFGGGVGVTRFLAERGADVLVTDTLSAEELAASVEQISDLPGVSFRLGEHNVSDFTTPDLLVVNPAVKPDNRFVRAAQAANIPITSEIRLLVKHLPNRLHTIGVTGSAGKSTTTAMIGHVLEKGLRGEWMDRPFIGTTAPIDPEEMDAATRTSRVWVGGNLGGSLLPHLDDISPDDWVVLELSSFMLERLREDKWSPRIAVITNITPNHLDWHGSFVSYRRAKLGIVEFQKQYRSDHAQSEDWLVTTKQVFTEISGEVHARTMLSAPCDQTLPLPGKHNAINAGLALTAVQIVGGDVNPVDLQDFPGLPHRLQFVGETHGIKCYNDSKSTTPEAAKLAIESFDPGKVRIILGGYDKGSDLAPLAAFAAEHCAGVYTIGDTGDAIADAAEAWEPPVADRPESCGGVNWPPPRAKVERCGTLDVAVERALADAEPGQVLVLSPGCASWDQFTNYEQRGERFVALTEQARD